MMKKRDILNSPILLASLLVISFIVLVSSLDSLDSFSKDQNEWLTGHAQRRLYGVAPCTSDSGCREGNICVEGSCVAGTREPTSVPVEGFSFTEEEFSSLIEQIPGFGGVEKINIYFAQENGLETEWGVLIEDRQVLEIYNYAIADPTFSVYTTQEVFDRIASSNNPVQEFINALHNREITLHAETVLGSIVIGFIKTYAAIYYEEIECTANADCAEGEICTSNNECVALEDYVVRRQPCEADADCPASNRCYRNECLTIAEYNEESARGIIDTVLGDGNDTSDEGLGRCTEPPRYQCFEGATCCADGYWHCNRGDGTPSCPEDTAPEEEPACECGTCPNGEDAEYCSSGYWCHSNECLTPGEWIDAVLGGDDTPPDEAAEEPNNDRDEDDVPDEDDNCPDYANPNQADRDYDGIGNVCENCPNDANANQLDTDGDGRGNVCDNCPDNGNANQLDTDDDGRGDICDTYTAPDEEEPVTTDLDDCIEAFMENEDFYTTLNTIFPGQNKVRVYSSTSPPAGLALPTNFIRSETGRQIVIRNDLNPGAPDGDGLYWNTVVHTLFTPYGYEAELFGNENYCVGPGDNSDSINLADGIDQKAYSVNVEDYRLTVATGKFVSNPYFLGILSCSAEQTDIPVDEIAEEEFGSEVYNSESVELSCNFLMGSDCNLWRIYQTAIFDRERIIKGFNEDVSDHCPGMTLDITLSGILPDGDDFCGEELDEVWGCP